MIIIINDINNLYIFSIFFINITFIIILEFVLKFLNSAIKFDFINDIIINKFIIILKFILKLLNPAIKFDFINNNIINKIKKITFIKKILISKILYKFKIKSKIENFIIEDFNYFFKNK